MAQNFPIAPAKPAATLSLLAIAAGCGLAAMAAVTILQSQPIVASLAATTCLGLALLFAWFALAQRWSSISIDDRLIELRVPLYGRSVPLDDIVAGSQAKVTLPSDSKFKLAWRTNGLSVPGYNLGWFRTQGAGTALAALTGAEAVTWSTRSGYAVLLSVADADAFLAALGKAMSRA